MKVSSSIPKINGAERNYRFHRNTGAMGFNDVCARGWRVENKTVVHRMVPTPLERAIRVNSVHMVPANFSQTVKVVCVSRDGAFRRDAVVCANNDCS